jgi:hypothetical protein
MLSPLTRSAVVVAAVFICIAAGGAQEKAATKPDIEITQTPIARDGDPVITFPIAGTVTGVDYRQHRVVVYAFAGEQWWVQPTAAAPKTPIDRSSGKWATDTHPGFRYAAALVTTDFTPENVSPRLPAIGRNVLAIDEVSGKLPR